jgi:hypothetical protein
MASSPVHACVGPESAEYAGRRWQRDDLVILTRSGDISCESHRDIFGPEAVVAVGTYYEIRAQQRALGLR